MRARRDDSKAARLARAVSMGVRGRSASGGEAGGVAAARACGVGVSCAGVVFAHGEEGRPSQGTSLVTFCVCVRVCQSLICEPVGVRFPTRGYSWWNRDERDLDTQNPKRVCGLSCPKYFLVHPPSSSSTPRTRGTMLGVWDRALELRGQACYGPSPSDAP